MELRYVAPQALDLTLGRLRQLPEGAVRAKLKSFRSKGQLSPLVAAEQEGVLVLVDGFVRQQAAVRLGLSRVLVEVVELSLVQMKVQMYLRNRERGLQLVEECRLVQELTSVDGLSQVEVGELLERHKSWVCRRLGLWKAVSPRLWQDVSVGLLGAGSLRRLAQLPVCNQEELVCVSKRDGLSRAETVGLIALWQRAVDGAGRQYLLDYPREALRRVRQKAKDGVDPRLGTAGQELQKGLILLSQVSLRLQRRMNRGIGEMASEGHKELRGRWKQASQQSRHALAKVERWLGPEGED
jgi:ubiquinone biosynthesis protein UbiJ